jgi:hypothetical protein
VDHAQFLYSTACEGENVNNASLDLEVACVRLLGADAFPVKVGINARDWRCATPSDAAGRFVPILIVPSDHFTPADVPFVAEAVGRLQSLADDVRAFFAEESGRSVHGTSVLVQLGGADSGYVNQLASSSLSTAEYHNQLLSDLGPAKLFATAASGRIWVMPYVSEENNPSKLGAGAQGAFAFLPPAAGQSACSSAPSASYDAAFYAFGHNAGLALGLKLTHEYGMSLPDDWQTSIMASGAGTRSQLFPFEEKALTEALDAWQ